MINNGIIGILVNLESTKQSGTTITHINTLSNKKVIAIFPPERITKYTACAYATNGIVAPSANIMFLARC